MFYDEIEVEYFYNIFVENNYVDLRIFVLFFIYDNLGDFEIDIIIVCWCYLDFGWIYVVVEKLFIGIIKCVRKVFLSCIMFNCFVKYLWLK